MRKSARHVAVDTARACLSGKKKRTNAAAHPKAQVLQRNQRNCFGDCRVETFGPGFLLRKQDKGNSPAKEGVHQ